MIQRRRRRRVVGQLQFHRNVKQPIPEVPVGEEDVDDWAPGTLITAIEATNRMA